MGELLYPLLLTIPADQSIKYSQNVTTVFHNPMENVPQTGVFLRFLMPLGQSGYGHFDVPAKLLGRVAAKKETVEEGRFALRELKILQSFVEWVGQSGHRRNRSLQISTSASRVRAA